MIRTAARRAVLSVAAGLMVGGMMAAPAQAAPLDPCVRDATECGRDTGSYRTTLGFSAGRAARAVAVAAR
jgi:hypothetical protein